MSTESKPRPRPVAPRVPISSAAFHEHAAQLVADTLRKWLRRAQVVLAVGLALFVAFVLAAIFFNDTKSVVNRNGQEVSGRVLQVIPGNPRLAKVQFTRGATTTTGLISLRDYIGSFEPGQEVQLSVDRDNPERSLIIGATKRERVTSMPVAGLLVSSLLVTCIGLFDLQAAARCRRHLKGNSWRTLRWSGEVYGPGRGRVRAAGWLTDSEAERQYLMVNATGCWRQGVDLLSEPCELAVAGNPAGIVVVRHPATLRVVLLRPPRGERQRQRALSLLVTGKA